MEINYKDEIYKQFVDIICKNKLINNKINNKIITEYVVNKTLSIINTEFIFDDYYNLALRYTIIIKIKEIYNNILIRQKKIYNILTIKFNIRKYINRRLYRYPDGLRLKQLKENFNKMSKIY